MKTMIKGLAALAFLCAPAWAQHTAITITPQSFDRYAGYYQLGPKVAVRLWREEDHYFFGTVGTPQKQEIFPESPASFFLKSGPVTLGFAGEGAVTEVIVNQAGREIHARRLEQAEAEKLSVAAVQGHPVPRTWSALNLTPKTLTTQDADSLDYWPCFSPDGKTVLFSRSLDGGKTWSLMRVAAAGGAAESFAKLPGSATRASWLGDTIVFNLDGADGSHAIWTMKSDGSNAHAVPVTGLSVPAYPTSDGQSIVVGDAARNMLYRVPQAGGAPAPLTDQAQVLAGMSSLSPDGKWIVFAGQKNSGQVYNQNENQIWLIDDKGAVHPLEATPLPGRAPVWSPDGKRIAFESDRGAGQYAAFLINRDGSGLVQVTDYALWANHPVFSPDGKKLLISMGDPAQRVSVIAVVDLPGT